MKIVRHVAHVICFSKQLLKLAEHLVFAITGTDSPSADTLQNISIFESDDGESLDEDIEELDNYYDF